MPYSQLRKAMRIWREAGFLRLVNLAFDAKLVEPIANRLWEGETLSNEEIQLRCAERGRLWEYDRPGVKEEVLSQHDDSDPFFRVLQEGYDWSPRKVCEITDAAIIGERSLVCDSDGNFISESVKPRTPWSSTENYVRMRPRIRLQAARRRTLPFREPTHLENAMCMTNPFQDRNDVEEGYYPYGHWLLEYLPMLLHLSVYEQETGRNPDIIVNKNPPGWIFESLDILGYPEDRIVEYDGLTVVDRLVFPFSSVFGHSPGILRMSPVEYRWLRDRFLESVDNTDTSANERIYVSRQGTRRHVTNFDEIEPVLEDFDIEVIRPEELSVKEQVRKFSRASLLVGVQGSGLHNSIFAKDATVVEVFPPDIRQHAQYLLDNGLGHDYHHMFGSVHDGEREEKRKHMSFQLDAEALRLTIEDALLDS